MPGLIPQTFITDLVSRCDIVDIISARLKLRKTGKNYSALCPFHHEKTPSFSVNPDKQFYHCFGCNNSGNVVSFLMEYDRLEFPDAIELLAQYVGVEVPYENNHKKTTTVDYSAIYKLMQHAARFYQQQLNQSSKATAYLKQRGLSKSTVEHFQLGFAVNSWDSLITHFGNNANMRKQLILAGMLIEKDSHRSYDRFRGRIMFPIQDKRGRYIGFGGRVLDNSQPKYLNSPETPIFQKSQELYGLYQVLQMHRQVSQIIIVEGYMDVIALAEHGIDYAVATLGTSTSMRHIELLRRYTHNIVFCFDGDSAGRNAAWRALNASLPVIRDGLELKFLFLPETEDPDSLIQKIGKVEFEHCIADAISFSTYFFEYLSSGLNLNSLEGHAQLAKSAAPLLDKLPPGFLHTMMCERLATLTHLSTTQLQQINTTQVKLEQRRALKARKPQALASLKLPSPMRLAIALLLQNPQIAQIVPNTINLEKLPQPGASILYNLFKVAHQQTNATMATMLEYWRDKPGIEQLEKLANWQHHIPETGIEAEFLGSLQLLSSQAKEERINNLIEKASKNQLDNDGKRLLQKLIREKD